MSEITLTVQEQIENLSLTTEELQVVEAISPTLTVERTEADDGVVVTATDYTGSKSATVYDGSRADRVTSLDGTDLAAGMIVEAVGVPVYVSDTTDYSAYGLTETGWYIFARIAAEASTDTAASVSGAAGYAAGTGYVDVAVRFETAAESVPVTVTWSEAGAETFIFKATDLAIRNLDYRTTFYVYDLEPFCTWTYAITTDTVFLATRTYYTLSDGAYIAAEVTVGDTVPEDTYYVHTALTIEGMTRNITYRLDTPIDCAMTFVLPEIEDDEHGCWYEFRFRHYGTYSSTLSVPEDCKIATEHTQSETAGINMIDLHYTNAGGVKLWRFMNTHSTIPS